MCSKKLLSIYPLFMFLFVMMMMSDSSCSDEEEDCEGKWSTTLSFDVKPLLAFSSEKISDIYKITEAREVLFSGTIYKVNYCTGKHGEIFEYYDVFDPKIYSLEKLKLGIWVGSRYSFDFEHEMDYLYISYTVTVTFEDNKIAYASRYKQIFNTDIGEDSNYKEYFLLMIGYYDNWQFQ